MKVEKTYKEVIEFANVSNMYLIKNKNEETKFIKCVENVRKQCMALVEAYNELAEDLRVKHCLVDATTKKIMRTDKGAFEFSQEGMNAFNKELRELNNTKVDLHARIIAGNEKEIDNLDSQEIDIFASLIFDYVDEFELQFKN